MTPCGDDDDDLKRKPHCWHVVEAPGKLLCCWCGDSHTLAAFEIMHGDFVAPFWVNEDDEDRKAMRVAAALAGRSAVYGIALRDLRHVMKDPGLCPRRP